MTQSLQLSAIIFSLFLVCQKEEAIESYVHPATELYAIWNRFEFGFTDCIDPFDNQTQFVEGSVSFASGCFYSTYALRNGADRINTVRFEADADPIRFLSTSTKWGYAVNEDRLELKTAVDNGCVRYFSFARLNSSL